MKIGTRVPVNPVTAALEIPDETVVLVNISESRYSAERTYGNYSIDACKPGIAYTTQEVHARRLVADMGDRYTNKRDPFKNTQQWIAHAEDIAEDLVREWNSDIWGVGSSITGEIADSPVRGFAGVFES